MALARCIAVVYRGAHPERAFAALEPRGLRFAPNKKKKDAEWTAVVSLPRRITKDELVERSTGVEEVRRVLVGVRGVDPDERRAFRTLDRNLRRRQPNNPRRIGLVMLAAEVAASPWLSRENAFAYRIHDDDVLLVVLKGRGAQQHTNTTNNHHKKEAEKRLLLRGGELRMALLEARAWGERFALRAK